MTTSRRQILMTFCCLALLATSAQAEDMLQKKARDLEEAYRAKIAQVVQWCEVKGLDKARSRTLTALTPTDPNQVFIPILPNEIGPTPLWEGASDLEKI